MSCRPPVSSVKTNDVPPLCASAAETGGRLMAIKVLHWGGPHLSPPDRTQLARPPITCACAENACLIRLNAVSEQGQVRVVKWRFRASISLSGKLLSRIAILLSVLCACAFANWSSMWWTTMPSTGASIQMRSGFAGLFGIRYALPLRQFFQLFVG